ncbi:putative transporter yoaV [Proteiniborus sp. DW1]|uniref:DMT family transporter n=1 Tax=Proteiniborus sp. DW1 TaxID=1889883 RepID=UPI00092DFEEC|nr:DMT family transporter [Proteiniborus sp. DW1]SCG82927.1 putative transporter yoaV [Proteiniborus sp. DW1]
MREKKEAFFTRTYIVTILGLFSCFLWGSAFPSVKIGYELFSVDASNSYEKIVFAGFRFFISSMMIFIFCLVTKRPLRINKEDIPKVGFLGIMQTTIQYIFFYIGLSNTSGTKGSILSATTTFFSVLLAHFFYKEDKLSVKRISGVILGFLGVTIVNLGGSGFQGGFNLTGDGFIIISSLVGALAGIYTKKVAKNISPFAVSGYQLFIGSIFLIIVGILGGGENIDFTLKGMMLLLYLGFISAAAFSLWTILLKYNSVGRISIYKFSVPLFGVLLSYIFLGERLLGINIVLGIVLVSSGIIMINKE